MTDAGAMVGPAVAEGVVRVALPGKLMVAGEYSVLRPGGLALAFAAGVAIEVEAWRVPSEADGLQLVRRDTGAAWKRAGEVPADLRFLLAGLRAGGLTAGRVAAWAPRGTGIGDAKQGLGGSAAAVVAGLLVAHRLRDIPIDPDRFVTAAVVAHAAEQGGRGSGYDVATIALGGATLWRVDHTDGAAAVSGTATALPLPTGLEIMTGFAGNSASTTKLVGRAMAALSPAERDAALEALGRPVGPLVAAVSAGDALAMRRAADDANDALRHFDRLTGAGIMTDRLETLLAAARELAPCRVSGAGGGDSVIAFDVTPGPLAVLEGRWRQAGFSTQRYTVAPNGAVAFGVPVPTAPTEKSEA
ncbi:MAG: hypothetical protein IV100_01250 [Myxococcales bacterium]|nr:hypothetical protein [Myxococcales bacterium]